MSTPSATGVTGPSENRPTTTSDEVEVNLETEESAQDQSENKNLKKSRRFTSKVWDDFTREDLTNGERIAKCNHCKRKFVGKGTDGTTHLKKHLSTCLWLKHRSSGKQMQQILQASKDIKESGKIQNWKFDQAKSSKDLAIMIIKEKYPFTIGDSEWFENFCNGLNPNFKVRSRNSLRSDVLLVHKEQKENLYSYLDSLSYRVSFTTDIWTSDHSDFAYACLTVHFINDNWQLKKRMLAYREIPCPHDGETLFKFISELFLEWNLDKKVFSMVVDNASSNDSMVKHLKSWLLDKSLLPICGDLFHVRCSAHILNLVVQDGLANIIGLLTKIRETIRYSKRSTYAMQKFENALNQCKLKGHKKVAMDVQTRWNSTFKMLDSAIPLKEAFERLEQIDKNYKHNPSEEDWKVAVVVRDCLKLFYDATCHFSGTNFPTSNIFFPDICLIQLELKRWKNSPHEFIRTMAGPMEEKFVKYWKECSLVLTIAVVLDPRFKMDLVNYYYEQIYGYESGHYIERIRNAFVDMYLDYGGSLSPPMSLMESGGDNNGGNSSSMEDKLSDFDKWYKNTRSSNITAYQKSELDTYLDEPVFPRNENFNILEW